MAEFEKMELASADLVAERVEQIKQLLPEVASEGGIDFDKLRLLLGDEVDEGTERYAFTWPGKADAIRQSQTPSTATLRPAPEESVNWDETENLYIEGDNLEVLKLLQHAYHGRVKLIYIDPPYNTGHDFVYKDKFGDTIENYREQAGLGGQSNADTSGRYHSDWCSMMYPRLRLARELLTDNGIVCISIDEHEDYNLQKLCNEVFGEANFIAKIALLCNPKGRSQDKYVATCHEYILIYSKMSMPAGSVSVPKTDDDLSNDYKLFDPETGLYYREVELRNTHRDFGLFNRPNLYYPFYVSEGGELSLEEHPHTTKVYPIWDDGFEGCWTWAKSKAHNEFDLLTAKRVKGQWKIYRKAYAGTGDERPLKQVKSIWTDKLFFTERGQQALNELFDEKGKLFQSPKSVDLIAQCIRMAQDPQCIVMDFFSGSATTTQAIMQVNFEDGGNRRFILVQMPESLPDNALATKRGYETICEIGKERIRRAGAKIAAEIEEANKQLRLGEEPRPVPDVGFRVFKLDESGIERPKPGQLLLDVVRPDRSDEDIIFEMMLKWGLELTLPIERVDAAGYPCYSIAYGELVCCLSDGLNMRALDAIANMEPRRVLMLDRILDDTTKLNAVQAFKRVEEKTGREVELRTL